MSPLLYDGIDHPVEIGPGRGDLRYSSVPLMPGAGFQPSTVSLVGRQVSYAQLFATQIWVAAAVMRLLSWSIRVPLKAYRRVSDDDRQRLSAKDHRLAKAIIDPWERGSQADLVQSLLGPLLVHGNALNEIDQGARGVLRFEPRDYRYASPICPFRGSVSGWNLDVDEPATRRTVAADTVLHTRWWSAIGALGTSPLQQLGTTIGIEDAAQRHQKAMLSNGARVASAITTSEEFLRLKPEERDVLMKQLREDVNSVYAGPENSGRPAILPPGLDWKEAGSNAQEAQLIEQRKVAREEVCAVYQMPPPMLGILDRATFSNITVQREMAYTDSLGPPLVLIEQTLNAQLVRALLREDDIYVEFDFSGVLRGDRLREIQALREAIASALLTPNEGRAIDNRPRSDAEGMDDFYLPTNNLGKVGTDQAGDGTAQRDIPADEQAAAVAEIAREAAEEAVAQNHDPAPVGA